MSYAAYGRGQNHLENKLRFSIVLYFEFADPVEEPSLVLFP